MITINTKTKLIRILSFVLAEQAVNSFTSRSCATKRYATYSSNRFPTRSSWNTNRSVRIQSSSNDEEVFTENLSSSSSSSDTTVNRRKKRIRKKDATVNNNQISIPNPSTTSSKSDQEIEIIVKQQQPKKEPTISLKPRDDSRVTILVQDVRDLTQTINRKSDLKVSESTSSTSNLLSSLQAKFTSSNEASGSIGKTNEGTKSDLFTMDDDVDYESMDPIKRMLFDAQEMKRKEKYDASVDNRSDEKVDSIGNRVRGVVSTLVTVDFFIVCGFLLWFLAGIFSSYVLKDDTIQILFNSNFQLLVQPALGILMIAALADAVFKRGDENE